LGIYPTLVFQAAAADVSLDFGDRNRPEDSSSLDGRGRLFATGLDLTRSLCGSCPWFAGASYHFQRLPDLNADRSPPFNPPGFEILEDEVQLSRDVHEASTRIGYGFSGNRVVSYLGASHRWTDVEIEDHLRYRDPFQTVETALDSRTRLESEVTLALAGVEARLGSRLFSRLETSVGEGDWGVLFRVVYTGRSEEPPRPQNVRQRAREIEKKIAPDLARIEAAFLIGWKSLKVVEGPDGQPAYLSTELEEFLKKTEEDILNALDKFPEFEALRDWVRARFNAARSELGLPTSDAAPVAPGYAAVAVIASSASLSLPVSRVRLAQADKKTTNQSKANDLIAAGYDKGKSMARSKTPLVTLTFEAPLGSSMRLEIFPRYNPEDKDSPCYRSLSANETRKDVYWGQYAFNIYQENPDKPTLRCPGQSGGCPLVLVDPVDRCKILWCESSKNCKTKECRR
jgi:hypothetical protein